MQKPLRTNRASHVRQWQTKTLIVILSSISYKLQFRQDCLKFIQNKQTNNLNFGHFHWTKNTEYSEIEMTKHHKGAAEVSQCLQCFILEVHQRARLSSPVWVFCFCLIKVPPTFEKNPEDFMDQLFIQDWRNVPLEIDHLLSKIHFQLEGLIYWFE